MHFPNSGSGRPFVRIDGRSGSFALSVPDGGDLEIVEMHGKKLDLDIAGAEHRSRTGGRSRHGWRNRKHLPPMTTTLLTPDAKHGCRAPNSCA